ncbi:MlaD family protein [Roseivivax sp. CAU 1761]
METRANHVLIGAFALAGLLGILGLFLWFARVELDRQFAYYDIRFDSVSGLSNASDVRFAGLPVGQVAEVRLAPERDGTVLVRVEVDAATPVRVGSEATIEAQGVTGVSYVGISAGDPGAPLLAEVAAEPVPEIPSGRSVLQALSEDAPTLLAETLDTVRGINQIVTPENRDRIGTILRNVEAASGDFSAVLSDFSAITDEVSSFARQIDRFNTTLESLTEDFSVALVRADEALVAIRDLAEDGQGLVRRSGRTLDLTDTAMASAGRYLEEDLPALTSDMQRSVARLSREMTTLTRQAEGVLDTFDGAGAAALARFEEAEPVIAETLALIDDIDRMTAVVQDAAEDFDFLVEGEGTALVVETRAVMQDAAVALAAIAEVAEEDLPAIIADIRAVTEMASRTMEEVSRDVTEATAGLAGLTERAGGAIDDLSGRAGRAVDDLNARIGQAVDAVTGQVTASVAAVEADLDASLGRLTGSAEGAVAELQGEVETMLRVATGTFANANFTLAAINSALATGERTLEAAETVFDKAGPVLDGAARAVEGADRVINEDVAAITGDLRAALGNLDAALAQVSDDLPAVTGDLRAAAREAGALFGDLRGLVAETGGPLGAFASGGLPQFTALAAEARDLIANLEKLTQRIARDPARFLLGNDPPAFRR